MSEALSTCPFCNSNEHLTIEAVGSLLHDMPSRPYRVVCTHIDHDTVTGPVAYGLAAAITAWNHRPAAEALERELKELREEYSTYEREVKQREETFARKIGDQEVRAEAAERKVAALEAINANLMGDDEDKPRYTTRRMKQEVARQTEVLRQELLVAEADKARLSEALRKGREIAVDVMKALMTTGSRDNLLLADTVHKADDAARAALSGSGSGWRAMDSAPKDATVLIAVERTNGKPMHGNEMRSTYPAYIDEQGRMCDVSTWKAEPGYSGEHFRTVAWQPLPAAPQQGGE